MTRFLLAMCLGLGAMSATAQIIIDDFSDGDHDGWFEGSSKYDVYEENNALRVDVTGVFSWRVFGTNFSRIDMSNFNVISISIMLPDTTSVIPTLRMDLSDNNGYISNKNGFTFKPIADGTFHEYQLNYAGKFNQGWNSKGDTENQVLDAANIVKAEIFVMPGASEANAWTGTFYVDDLILLGAQDPRIVRENGIWKHYNAGTPAANWIDTSFVDTTWALIQTRAGYGGEGDATTIGFGSDSAQRLITQYFRQEFLISDTAAYRNVVLHLLADDGAIVYLNGDELIRENLPVGIIDSSTLAMSENLDTMMTRYVFPISVLDSGINVIAVEVHQASDTSQRMRFDCRIKATHHDMGVIRGPYLQQSTDTSIIVRWRTLEDTEAQLRYGTSMDLLSTVLLDDVTGPDHSITITGLTPNTTYYYQIAESVLDTLVGDSATFFKTHPVAGTTDPFKVWVIGDAGKTNRDQRGMRDAYEAGFSDSYADLWLLLGDNAYNEGHDEEYQVSMFEDMFEEQLKHTNLYPCPGNHDLRDFDNPIADAPYYKIFDLPTKGEAGGIPSGTEAYYSYDYANVHFIALDSYDTDRDSTGEMATWLKADAAATTLPWTVAYWHHPPYTKGSHNSDDTSDQESGGRLIDIREQIVPLIEAAGVDLVLTGHSHSYERSHLMKGHFGFSNTLSDAPHFVSHNENPQNSGSLGVGEEYYKNPIDDTLPNMGTVYTVLGCSGLTSNEIDWLDEPENLLTNLFFQKSYNEHIGSMMLYVHGDTLTGEFIDKDEVLRDSFTIIKDTTKQMTIHQVEMVADVGLELHSTVDMGFEVYPNPVQASTSIRFVLDEKEQVNLMVYDQQGRTVATLLSSEMTPGSYQIQWDGASSLAQGVYEMSLVVGDQQVSRRVVKR